jgi:hypothetical protein
MLVILHESGACKADRKILKYAAHMIINPIVHDGCLQDAIQHHNPHNLVSHLVQYIYRDTRIIHMMFLRLVQSRAKIPIISQLGIHII